MKITFVFQIAYLVFAASNIVKAGEQLTNHVALPQKTIHLSISGSDIQNGFTLQSILWDKEVVADRQLHWILHNESSNYADVVFLGMSNSFDFNLFGSDGVNIPKTTLGNALSRGPESRTNAGSNPHVRGEGYKGGQVMVRDFPKMVELFNIPSNGIYTFELKYWTWIPAKKQFILSDPVRVLVLKAKDNFENQETEKHK